MTGDHQMGAKETHTWLSTTSPMYLLYPLVAIRYRGSLKAPRLKTHVSGSERQWNVMVIFSSSSYQL